MRYPAQFCTLRVPGIFIAARQGSLHCSPPVSARQTGAGTGVSPTTLAEINTMDRAPSAGFTLIELLISVAIVAILSAVAIPSYTDHVKRGHAAAAAAALATLRVSLEQFYQDNRSYGAGGACGVTMPWSREFSYGCRTASDGQGFLVTATGNEARGMGGFTYTVDHAGLRRTTGLPQGWGTVPSECWVRAKGGTC